jgi:hypothetical protein
VGSSYAASTPTFDFTSTQFIEKINNQLRKDGADVTKTCHNDGDETACIFSDVHFQQSVVGMKKLNLINGAFALKDALSITETDGKVSMIAIFGDRGDPVNIFHFVGLLGSSLAALNPSLTAEEITKETFALGVMRGDSDPTIGQPKMNIFDHAVVKCNNQNSDITTKIGCLFLPRS